MLIDIMCAEGPDLRKSRPRTEKAAGATARKRPRPIPLQSLSPQAAVAAPAPQVQVPDAAVADLPMVYVEAVVPTAGAHAHVTAQAVE